MEGHRRRYAFALAAMFCGLGMLYIAPLITRATIDGVITTHPTANLSRRPGSSPIISAKWGAGLRWRWSPPRRSP